MIAAALLSLTLRSGDEALEIGAEDLSVLGCTFRMSRRDAECIPGRAWTLHGVYRGLREIRRAQAAVDIWQEDETPYLIRFRAEWTDSPAFSGMIRQLMTDLAAYTGLKNAGNDAAMAAALTGYPAQLERDFPGNFRSWRHGLLSGAVPDAGWRDALHAVPSLAVGVTAPGAAERLLTMSAGTYWQDLLNRAGLGAHPLSERLPDCVALGHLTCSTLLPDPDRYSALLAHCRSQGMSTMLLLPPMPEDRLAQYRDLLTVAAGEHGPEQVIVGDVGPAMLAAEAGLTGLVFSPGPLLARRRKDPRLPWYLGDSSLLTETDGDSAAFRTFLTDSGVNGPTARECCGYPIAAGPGDTVRLPFYITAVSARCTLAGVCHTGRRDGLPEGADCGTVCREHCFLYGSGWPLVGRGNALYGTDLRSLTDSRYLTDILARGAARLLVELL